MSLTDVVNVPAEVARKAVNAPYLEFIAGLAVLMVFVVAPYTGGLTFRDLVTTGALWPLALIVATIQIGNAAIACVKAYAAARYMHDWPPADAAPAAAALRSVSQ